MIVLVQTIILSIWIFQNWKSGNHKHLKIWKRCAPGNDRYLSSQKCFNFRGVLICEKADDS